MRAFVDYPLVSSDKKIKLDGLKTNIAKAQPKLRLDNHFLSELKAHKILNH